MVNDSKVSSAADTAVTACTIFQTMLAIGWMNIDIKPSLVLGLLEEQ